MMLIRVDDYPSGSPHSEIQKGYQAALERFHAAMDGVPYLLGVVPTFVTDDEIRHVKALGPAVAVHGINHMRGFLASLDKAGTLSTILRACRQRLGTNIFIPPYNLVWPGLAIGLQDAHFDTLCMGPEWYGRPFWPSPTPMRVVAPHPKAYERLCNIDLDSLPEDCNCIALHLTWEWAEDFKRVPAFAQWAREYARPWL